MATVLGSEELKVKDCGAGAGAGVSTAENLTKEQTHLHNCVCVYKPLSEYPDLGLFNTFHLDSVSL